MHGNILSDLIITNIISATTIYTEAGAKVKRERRTAWAFVYKYEGETEYNSKNTRFFSNADSVILLPRNSSYEWICRKSGHCIIVDFECDNLNPDIFSFRISSPEKTLKKFRELEYMLTLQAPMFRQECIKDIYELIISLSAEKQSAYIPSEKSQKIAPAINYITKNYARAIKNDELAALCGLSTVYFRKLFAEIYSDSPINYIHKLRINKAKEMLASDFASISAVAHSLGYSNIYDFSRVFKKHTGISPSKYKKD